MICIEFYRCVFFGFQTKEEQSLMSLMIFNDIESLDAKSCKEPTTKILESTEAKRSNDCIL